MVKKQGFSTCDVIDVSRWNQSLKEMSLSSMVVYRWPSPIFVVNGGLVQWRFIGVLVPPRSHRHFEMMTKCLIWQDTSSKLRFTLAMFKKTHKKNTQKEVICVMGGVIHYYLGGVKSPIKVRSFFRDVRYGRVDQVHSWQTCCHIIYCIILYHGNPKPSFFMVITHILGV